MLTRSEEKWGLDQLAQLQLPACAACLATFYLFSLREPNSFQGTEHPINQHNLRHAADELPVTVCS